MREGGPREAMPINYRFVRRLLISDGAFEQRTILLCSGDELAS